ncbi:DJ-1/PfpI family protein [Patescibacteria group bacterium]|nr:DJ-1/PfpI family protein [Patescibacteria group bacterium]
MRKRIVKERAMSSLTSLLSPFVALSAQALPFLKVTRQTGITITLEKEGKIKIWEGIFAGKRKPMGPLAGKTIGILAASEFSDFQAYYLTEYLSEFGGNVDFLLVDWVKWKFSRPNVKTKGVIGQWGLSLDPIPTITPKARYTWRSLTKADPKDYDALIIMGGHSADIMTTEDKVIDFVKSAHSKGAVVGGIGGGDIPLITSGILQGKRVTGNKVVSFMLEKIGTFIDLSVVRDGKVVTARDTVDTPAFVRELCTAFDPTFVPERKDILKGKRIVIIAGEDFEDVELCVPAMEFIYRGARVTLAPFPPPMRARPPMLGVDVVMGNFGISVPFQEIPEGDYYNVVPLCKLSPEDFDLIMIPGAFCPWNCVVAGMPVKFLKKTYDAGKIVAGICHGSIPVSAAGLVEGKKIAGCLAVKDAVTIMGGIYNWDWSAVIDGRIVTGRVPDDVPEFIDAMTEALLSK